jgi:antitoxin component YwqK of YwqJK toxin-antitoxin module
MSKYLIPDILQYVLNEYLDHTKQKIYDEILEFKFDITKYTSEKPENFHNFLNCIVKVNHLFIDDKLIQITEYRKDSTILNKIVFGYDNNNKLISRDYKEYFEDGSNKYREKTLNEKLHGYQYNSYCNGNKKYMHYYIGGKKDGTQYDYYENGKKQYESNYKKGIKNGFQYEYKKNGKVKTADSYTDGRPYIAGNTYKTSNFLKM